MSVGNCLISQIKDDAMRTYKAFYNGKQIELQADSSYAAQKLAALKYNLKPKHEYKVTIVLCDVPFSPNQLPGS